MRETPFSPEMSERDREMMDRGLWYRKAKEKVKMFLPSIDPELTVTIRDSVVTPDDPNRPEYETATLFFSHDSDPNLTWTMEIKPNDEYLNNGLEQAVRKIYQEKKLRSTASSSE